ARARPAAVRLRRVGPGRRQRQPDNELAAAVPAGARRRDRAAVQLDETARDGEPDAEAAARLAGARLALREHLEYVRQEIRIETDAVVDDAHERFAGGHRYRDVDVSARSRVLGGVRQHVRERLHEARM